jgi:pyroglutamyl-peptidase
MHLIATERPDLRGGLVHVPCLPEQVTATGGPSMGLDTLARAVDVVVRTTIGVRPRTSAVPVP